MVARIYTYATHLAPAISGSCTCWASDFLGSRCAAHVGVYAVLAPAGVANCVGDGADYGQFVCPEYHASPTSDTPILYCVNHGARGADTLNARLLHTAFLEVRTQHILGL